MLSWPASAGSCSVLRSREARFFEGSSVQLAAWGVGQGTFADPVLDDGNLYFYDVETDAAASYGAAIGQMYGHAKLYGDPIRYTAPAVFDQWVEMFRGHHIVQTNLNMEGSATISQCGFGDCTAPLDTICIADPDGAGPATPTDPNGDGVPNFLVGDVVFIGSSVVGSGLEPKHATHMIADIADGDGVTCPAGSGNQWRMTDRIVPSDEPVGAGVPLSNAWLNSSHPVEGTYFLLGYKVGMASRSIWGSHGQELLPEGSAGTSCSLPGAWTSDNAVSHPLSTLAFPNPQISDPLQCTAGNGGHDCLAYPPSYAGWVQSADSVPVNAGKPYLVSGVVSPSPSGNDYLTLVTDAGSGGAETEIPSTQFTFDNRPGRLFLDRRFGNGWPNWFWTTLTIPDGVDDVKVRYVKGDVTPDVPLLDELSLKPATEFLQDDAKPGDTANFLINDPGGRTIVITGDSWAQPTHAIADGLHAALAERFPGRDFNIVSTGRAGYSAGSLLTNWDAMVTAYDPLYVVILIGTNDCMGTTPSPESTYIANVTRVAIKALSHGTIPIFIGVAPTVRTDGSLFDTCHSFRDHERRELLNLVP